jgi:hypothetical protein
MGALALSAGSIAVSTEGAAPPVEAKADRIVIEQSNHRLTLYAGERPLRSYARGARRRRSRAEAPPSRPAHARGALSHRLARSQPRLSSRRTSKPLIKNRNMIITNQGLSWIMMSPPGFSIPAATDKRDRNKGWRRRHRKHSVLAVTRLASLRRLISVLPSSTMYKIVKTDT